MKNKAKKRRNIKNKELEYYQHYTIFTFFFVSFRNSDIQYIYGDFSGVKYNYSTTETTNFYLSPYRSSLSILYMSIYYYTMCYVCLFIKCSQFFNINFYYTNRRTTKNIVHIQHRHTEAGRQAGRQKCQPQCQMLNKEIDLMN